MNGVEEAVRTSLLCVVFSIQARGGEGGKGKILCCFTQQTLFPKSGQWWIRGVVVGLGWRVSQTWTCSRGKPRALSGCG